MNIFPRSVDFALMITSFLSTDPVPPYEMIFTPIDENNNVLFFHILKSNPKTMQKLRRKLLYLPPKQESPMGYPFSKTEWILFWSTQKVTNYFDLIIVLDKHSIYIVMVEFSDGLIVFTFAL